MTPCRTISLVLALLASATLADETAPATTERLKPEQFEQVVAKDGVIVLDVGVSRETDPETGKSRVVGDVAPDVAEVASWISPNPGGVGPMTRVGLLANVVHMATP